MQYIELCKFQQKSPTTKDAGMFQPTERGEADVHKMQNESFIMGINKMIH